LFYECGEGLESSDGIAAGLTWQPSGKTGVVYTAHWLFCLPIRFVAKIDESTANFRYGLTLFSWRLHSLATPNSSPGLAAQASAPVCKIFYGGERILSPA
jgi:hypothetical protein